MFKLMKIIYNFFKIYKELYIKIIYKWSSKALTYSLLFTIYYCSDENLAPDGEDTKLNDKAEELLQNDNTAAKASDQKPQEGKLFFWSPNPYWGNKLLNLTEYIIHWVGLSNYNLLIFLVIFLIVSFITKLWIIAFFKMNRDLSDLCLPEEMRSKNNLALTLYHADKSDNKKFFRYTFSYFWIELCNSV